MYPFTREETEAAIAKLAEMYPACFFVLAHQRRPLVKTIISDLQADGVPMSYEQIRAAVDWYQNSWGYLYNMKAGVKRVTLLGDERATVTASEERYYTQRLAEEKKLVKQQKEDRSRYEVSMVPTIMPKKPLIPASPPPAPPPPAITPTEDPLGYLAKIVEDARHASQTFPEAMRQTLILPLLCAIDAEVRRLIANIEKTQSSEAAE